MSNVLVLDSYWCTDQLFLCCSRYFFVDVCGIKFKQSINGGTGSISIRSYKYCVCLLIAFALSHTGIYFGFKSARVEVHTI